MKAISIGDMRHRIIFQEKVEVDDGHHGHTVTWKDVVTVWASVEPISGREYFYAHQISTEVTHRVKIRYRNDVNTKMRIKFGLRILEIISILSLGEESKVLEILCKE
jgi:SPP1 family predicted phage head-tail adaptor